jgi:hypothetical protein
MAAQDKIEQATVTRFVGARQALPLDKRRQTPEGSGSAAGPSSTRWNQAQQQ